MVEVVASPAPPSLPLTAEYTSLLQEGGVELFTALLDQSATATSLAERLGLPRARVNFMLNRLLADDLVRVDGERCDGKRIERFYRASVPTFRLEGNLASSIPERLAMAAYTLDRVQRRVMRAVTSDEQNLCLLLTRARVDERRLGAYMERLQALNQEFDAEDGGGEAPWFSLALALYPEGGEGR